MVAEDELAGVNAAAVAKHRLPGLAVARIGSDSSVTVAVAGTRSHDDETALGRDAPFHLGSDTKAMTAALLATFVEEGTLSLDATLGELFPTERLDSGVAAVALRDVLGHRSGLGDSTLDLRALHAVANASDARRAAIAVAMAKPDGNVGEYAYANVNYMVAGAVAEALGKAVWEELLIERLFKPLGIACGFGAPRGNAMPLGHTAEGEPVPDDAAVTDNPLAMGPAGAVHCSMADWAAFVASILANFRGEDSLLMSAATAADLFAGVDDYVAGWTRLSRNGETIFTHDGSNTLWYARAVLVVERNEAMLMASNTGESSAVAAMDELTMDFIGS